MKNIHYILGILVFFAFSGTALAQGIPNLPPISAPIATASQAKFYAFRMIYRCANKDVPTSAIPHLSVCQCVYQTALNEAISGSYEIRWSMLWNNDDAKMLNYVNSLPRDRQDMGAALYSGLTSMLYFSQLRDEYLRECRVKK